MSHTVSMSQADFEFMQARRRDPTAVRPALRARKRKEDLPENILESQICGYLRIRGWILTRQQVGLYVPFRILSNPGQQVHPIRIGEKGAADWLAMRPMVPLGECEAFYFETKAPGKKPRPEQLEWLERRRVAGFAAEWFDSLNDDFKDGHAFVPWYMVRFA